MARKSKKKASTRQAGTPGPAVDLLRLKNPESAANASEPFVHIMKKGIRCDTEQRGHSAPRGRSRLEIVVDASEGFIPLWEKDTTLRWRFRESSLKPFANPAALKTAIEKLLAEALVEWGDAVPIKFAKRDDAWDFEFVMKSATDCDINGCVLASAFFPDAGRHTLTIYPTMFEQDKTEQRETLMHEIGHIFGLRHFFAQISEASSASEIFGKHSKFSIMNYGANSKLTADDRADLKKLYQQAWSGQLTHINGTPIKFVKPFHTTGGGSEELIALRSDLAAARYPGRGSGIRE
ncbi:matrixin family metalloprotease [Bradyrhizobium sp.]|jgi:hypothetical protein|uniref:matrixin family metalloprotease n=1 Tax=Bradyrhizobium sp. TaxID=376 RepID=UPI002E029035|nr:matrixin family metalloprotease [Bradyrhizobium sp.]